MVAGLNEDPDPGEPTIQVIDPKTDKVVWGMAAEGHKQYGRITHEVRPMAFEAEPRRLDQAHVRAGDRHQRRLGHRLEQTSGRRHALAAGAACVEEERRRDSDRRHARPRGAARPVGALGVEPPRQPDLRLDAAGSEIHRRGGGWSDRQLDDVDSRQQVHVRRDLRRRTTRSPSICRNARSSPRSRRARARRGSAPRSCR